MSNDRANTIKALLYGLTGNERTLLLSVALIFTAFYFLPDEKLGMFIAMVDQLKWFLIVMVVVPLVRQFVQMLIDYKKAAHCSGCERKDEP
jgi:hypothetical protein